MPTSIEIPSSTVIEKAELQIFLFEILLGVAVLYFIIGSSFILFRIFTGKTSWRAAAKSLFRVIFFPAWVLATLQILPSLSIDFNSTFDIASAILMGAVWGAPLLWSWNLGKMMEHD